MIYPVTEDQKFLEMMTGQLRKRGKRALGISQTEELLIRLRQNAPDTIILDGNCPHIDALEILKDLKAKGCKGQTIVLGGRSSAPLVPEISRFGAIQTAGRPLAVNRILGAIRIPQEHLNTDLCYSSVNSREVMKNPGHDARFFKPQD